MAQRWTRKQILGAWLAVVSSPALAAPADFGAKPIAPPAKSAPTIARYTYTAQIRTAVRPSNPVVAGGISWQCTGSWCTASGPWLVPSVESCRALAEIVGAITAYGRPGRTLSAADLARCNATQAKFNSGSQHSEINQKTRKRIPAKTPEWSSFQPSDPGTPLLKHNEMAEHGHRGAAQSKLPPITGARLPKPAVKPARPPAPATSSARFELNFLATPRAGATPAAPGAPAGSASGGPRAQRFEHNFIATPRAGVVPAAPTRPEETTGADLRTTRFELNFIAQPRTR
ncbi:MAG: hypothetical protein DWQ09_14840 [Proteobacteria bacterium]|nr:MAG: hypothetical protein DWQ09_14840 [Pseudomonadota bacterium]QKK11652.1 MAG: hypothetical protein HND59_08685 [Pseudomonadota bacterium]